VDREIVLANILEVCLLERPFPQNTIYAVNRDFDILTSKEAAK